MGKVLDGKKRGIPILSRPEYGQKDSGKRPGEETEHGSPVYPPVWFGALS